MIDDIREGEDSIQDLWEILNNAIYIGGEADNFLSVMNFMQIKN